jgi:transcriptional regulator NrdR family protein
MSAHLPKLACPYCHTPYNTVIDSRPVDRSQIWRRRKCATCAQIFTTQERIVGTYSHTPSTQPNV